MKLLFVMLVVIAGQQLTAAVPEKITKQDIRDAVARRYAIIDAIVEESHLTAIGKRNEGMFYKLKCLETLLKGDPLISTNLTGDYEKKAVLKHARYYLIVGEIPYLRAEKWDSTGRRRNEILKWVDEVKSENSERR